MPLAFRPPAGQIVLIEPQEFAHPGAAVPRPATGVVEAAEDDRLTIVGVMPSDLPEGTAVVVSIFAPEALFRIRASAHWLGPDRLTIDPIHDVERIQRRQWSRHELHLDVTVAPLGGLRSGATGVRGRTLDIGMGGLRIETESPLASQGEFNVVLMLPDGAPLVARVTVVALDVREGSFEYRLAFDELDEFDTTNLAALLDPQATAADIRRKAATGRAKER